MLAAVVQEWGYDVTAVEDGEAAWQVLQADEAPRLLLLDWEMPKLDGLALCQRIRLQQSNDPPFIILLTSHSEDEDISAGLESGANDFISKPFQSEILQVRLQIGEKVLNLQRSQIELNKS